MMMEIDSPRDALIDALVGEEGYDIKNFSPGTSLRRARPRYKVMYEDIRSREIDERLEKLYPLVDQTKTPLPLRWNHQDRSCYISLSENNRRVTYNDQAIGRPIKDAAAVRAEHPVPVTCGVFYFEVTISAEGNECCLGVGLCEKAVDLNRLPGWDKYSYGYHGDDGNFFSSSGAGTPYGPTFSSNDVIGCGINFVTNSIFFTKNGENLGVAISNIARPRDLFPMVGLQKNGAIYDSNFGQQPFKYDIEKEFKEAREYILGNMKNLPLSANKTNYMDLAVFSWLCHEGYGRALGAFMKQAELRVPANSGLMSLITDEPGESLNRRRVYQELIIAGKTAEVIERVKVDYPTLFELNKELTILMKCQLFTEIYAEANHIDIAAVIPTSPNPYRAIYRKPRPRHLRFPGRECYAHVYSKNGVSFTLCAPSRNCGTVNPFKRRGDQAQEEHEARRVRTACEESDSSVQIPHVIETSVAESSQRNEPEDDPMEGKSEDVSPSSNGVTHASNGIATINSNDYIGDAKPQANGVANTAATSATTIVNEEGAGVDSQQDLVGDAERCFTSYPGWIGGNAKDMMSQANMLSLLELGRLINNLLSEIPDPPESLSKRVKDTLALICHTKPLETGLRYLLEPSVRTYTATALNSALREQMGYLSQSILTVHCRQARRLRQKLADEKIGEAPFLDIDELITKQMKTC